MEQYNKQTILKTINATKPMNDAVTRLVNEKNYKIITLDLSSEIIIRYGNPGAITTMKLTIKDPQNNIQSLLDYCSTDNDISNKELAWVCEFIKKKEKEIIEDAIQSDTKKSNEVRNVNETTYEVSGERKVAEMKLNLCFCSNADEMREYLTKKEFIQLWAGETAKFNENNITFENIELKDIKIVGEKVCLKYKWAEWTNFSSVSIYFEDINSNLKVTLIQTDIPAGLADNVRNHWVNRIFVPISVMFRCALKPI